MLEEERKTSTRNTIIMFSLATIVGINLVVTGILWQAYQSTAFDLKTTQIALEDLLGRVHATSQYIAIGNVTLTFTPYMQVQKVSGTTITYLLGFVNISNLTNIIARPLVLTVMFEPNVTYPDWGNVSYDYTDVQALEIPPGLDVVMMPWGAFPVTLEGFVKGDEIIWRMTVTAVAEWVGLEVARVQLEVTFKLVVR